MQTPDIIKIRLTKVARKNCGAFVNSNSCLLATALTRKGYNVFGVWYHHADIDGVRYHLSDATASRVHRAYDVPKSKFKPFTITIRRANFQTV